MKAGYLMTAVLGLVLVGCGDEGGADGGDISRFVGTWKYSSGMFTRICAGQAQTIAIAGGDEEFAKAVGGGLTLKGTCATKLSVVGNSASASEGASCTEVGNDGSASTYMYSTLTYTTANGRSMTLDASGTVTYVGDGQSIACTFSASASLTKYAE